MAEVITYRYWVFSTWECHEPYSFRGCYNTLEEAKQAIPPEDEIAEIYDVLDIKRCVWWNGTNYARIDRGYNDWEDLQDVDSDTVDHAKS